MNLNDNETLRLDLNAAKVNLQRLFFNVWLYTTPKKDDELHDKERGLKIMNNNNSNEKRNPFCLFNLIVLTYFNFHKSIRWFERSHSNRILHSYSNAWLLHLLWSCTLCVANHTSTDHLTTLDDSQLRLVTISSVPFSCFSLNPSNSVFYYFSLCKFDRYFN